PLTPRCEGDSPRRPTSLTVAQYEVRQIGRTLEWALCGLTSATDGSQLGSQNRAATQSDSTVVGSGRQSPSPQQAAERAERSCGPRIQHLGWRATPHSKERVCGSISVGALQVRGGLEPLSHYPRRCAAAGAWSGWPESAAFW